MNTEEEEIKKVVDAQKNIQERNRRMLGGLNGYLKKAESRLKQDQGKVRVDVMQMKEKMEIEEKNIQREKEQMTQLQLDKLR